ncbi:ATP synthase subunit I [Comamonas sp. NLF-1-9]|uniref:ATP synthase subunit I n=1 Tax=Comamonas sp. NLF-1-9 TaxID=2853163 RepID=UPI00210601E1|nr:ATP synthase subunit I [Comamonas sp. NLF-1-9]
MSSDASEGGQSRGGIASGLETGKTRDAEDDFKALTPEEARQWRLRHPQMPVSRALRWQLIVGVVAASVTGLLTRRPELAWSVAYGALAGFLPAAIAAAGTMRWARPGFPPTAALAGLLVWEVVKLVLTAGLLLAAPRFLGAPNWPALLIGLVLTIKMYWVGLLWVRPLKSGKAQTQKEHTDGC